MRSVLVVLGCIACAALGDPQPLTPTWPPRAFEQELGAKGVVVELPQTARALVSRQLAQRLPGARIESHARMLLDRVGEAAAGVEPASVRGEGPNALVFDGVWVDQDDASGGRTLMFVSLRDTQPYEIERTWMAYEPATTGAVDGLAVIIPGTFGYPPELYEKLSDDLRQRGWSVLRLLSQPSRFTERVDFRIEAGEGAQRGAEFASHADDRTAECAFAIEAAAKWIEGVEGALEGKPRALLGFSGGAILAPAVVAREPDRYETVALVAGGANAASISIDSTFMKQFIRSALFEFTGESAAQDRADFEAAYLERASLDAYHAAASFEDDARVLVLDGSFDKAVPFESSTLMFERLEASGVDPIRRTYPSNHIMLFMSLGEMIDDLSAWVDGGELALPPGQEAREPVQAP